ncbi:hypothetical protein JTE90_025099 [Oedothorax gibbosus]|uniref:Uncharacterized protein n=1 Tax=Oedothorax gibbosus TaxID=931172 RepID=A0AAV6TPJ5_9ARAC|nr:hypothetical protein JTE90_025099 [Oedothorax gibbosus]
MSRMALLRFLLYNRCTTRQLLASMCLGVNAEGWSVIGGKGLSDIRHDVFKGWPGLAIVAVFMDVNQEVKDFLKMLQHSMLQHSTLKKIQL